MGSRARESWLNLLEYSWYAIKIQYTMAIIKCDSQEVYVIIKNAHRVQIRNSWEAKSASHDWKGYCKLGGIEVSHHPDISSIPMHLWWMITPTYPWYTPQLLVVSWFEIPIGWLGATWKQPSTAESKVRGANFGGRSRADGSLARAHYWPSWNW